jgi:glycosyltransferase involved in cell wall biosynthesis
MIRVAFDMTPERLSGAGVGTYSRELRSHIDENNGVHLLEIAHELTGQDNLARRVSAGLHREGWFYPRGLERAATRVRADLIHSPASTPARSRSIPLVVTIHDAIPWRNPEWFTRANAFQQRLLVSRTARHATRVITDSHSSKDDLVNLVGLDPDRVDVIHLGVSSAFSPTLRDREWLEQRFNIAGPVVLSVGTPEPRKNLISTLRAFEQVRRTIPEATLLLVGDAGWRSAEADAYLAQAGPSVVRAGRVEFTELTVLYASADCFLFPSLREGFGLPPLEAMASGTPVVCSNAPSLPEVVGDASLTTDPNDVHGLASAVIDVLSDTKRAADLRQRGLEQSNLFTWERTVDLTVETYRRALHY